MISKKSFHLAAFAAAALAVPNTALAEAQPFASGDGVHVIMLEAPASYRLEIEQDGPQVDVSLIDEDRLVIGLSIGNAIFDAGDVVTTTLCADCDPVVFIPVPDASSTYGAITGILAWPDGAHWHLSILPLRIPFVTGADDSGVSTLKDTWFDDRLGIVERSYGFYRGSVFPVSDWDVAGAQ